MTYALVILIELKVLVWLPMPYFHDLSHINPTKGRCQEGHVAVGMRWYGKT